MPSARSKRAWSKGIGSNRKVANRRLYGAVVVPPAPAGNWPGQVQGGWGLSWNGTAAEMDEFYNALTGTRTAFATGTGQKAYFDWVRVEARMAGTLVQTSGAFSFDSMSGKLAWCKTNHVGVIFDLTYAPWQWATKPTFSCTGTARVQTGTDKNGNPVFESRVYIPSIGSASWSDLTIHGHPGLPGTQHVTTVGTGNIGTDATGKYLVVNGAVTNNNTTANVIFGGWKDPTGAVHAGEDDNHMPVDPSHYMDLARLGQALCEWAQGYGVPIIIEYWNEGNGSTFRKPGVTANNDPDSYVRELMYLTRAVKEWDPTIAVAHTGTSGQSNTGDFHWKPIDWYKEVWRLMLLTTAGSPGALWKSWCTSTTDFISNKSNFHMAGLVASGWIDDDFVGDYFGRHLYCFSHTSKNYGSITNARMWDTDTTSVDRAPVDLANLVLLNYRWDPNRLVWSGAAPTGTYVLKVTVDGVDKGNTVAISVSSGTAGIASAIQTKAGGTVRVRVSGGGNNLKVYFEGANADHRVELSVVTQPTTGVLSVARTGISKMNVLSTESGGPWHPLAVTGVGWNGGGSGRNSNVPALINPNPFSSEEMAVNVTVLRQTLKKQRPYPTGGSMPTLYPGVGDIRDRMGVFTLQRLNEHIETYPGASSFYKQGFRTAEAEGQGSEIVPTNVLKRALPIDATRRFYTASTRNGVAIPASAIDGVTGF